jgi:hypothetical protein
MRKHGVCSDVKPRILELCPTCQHSISMAAMMFSGQKEWHQSDQAGGTEAHRSVCFQGPESLISKSSALEEQGALHGAQLLERLSAGVKKVVLGESWMCERKGDPVCASWTRRACVQDGHFRFNNGDNIGSRCECSSLLLCRQRLC